MTTRPAAAADHPQEHRVGGDLAPGPQGAAVRSGHARGEDRRRVVHQRADRIRDVIHNCNADGFDMEELLGEIEAIRTSLGV